jgi:anthranilate synthase component I
LRAAFSFSAMDRFEEFIQLSRTASVVPVVDRMPADLLTPLAAYLKLARGGQNSFLLESVEGGENLARYSFIGSEPHSIVSGNRRSLIERTAHGTTKIERPVWDHLKEHFQTLRAATSSELPSFLGGAIGYFGFSCAGWFEPTVGPAIVPETEAEFMFFRSIVAYDHAKQTINLVSLVFRYEIAEYGERAAFDRAVARNSAMRQLLEEGPIELPEPVNVPGSAPESNWERSGFESAVKSIKESIRAGDCYQVVLSQCFSRQTEASPVAIYRALRSMNPSPYMFLLQLDGSAVIGASPEMLVRARGKELEYRPIAGTRPRGSTQEVDERLAEEMRADAKEVAEHQMLVDLGRNDLGRVAKFGTVEVKDLMKVEKYSHVQHLVSSLTAELRDGCDRFDAFAACFPAGTVSGAPKVRAIEMIHDLEPTMRGIYAGAVGYFDYSGNMDTCIAIRTLSLSDGVAKVQAGAGIVADSVPKREYDETVNKARALLKAIDIAEGLAR